MTQVFNLTGLQKAAGHRPAGYLEDVLSRATVEGDKVILTDEAYAELVAKYRPSAASPTEPVSFTQKLKNFTKSAVKHVAAGMPMCTEEQVAARFAICQGCEFFKDGACQKCGCPLVREKKFISKLSWAHEVCPVGKWGKVDTGS